MGGPQYVVSAIFFKKSMKEILELQIHSFLPVSEDSIYRAFDQN
jgi:hypothetical protein